MYDLKNVTLVQVEKLEMKDDPESNLHKFVFEAKDMDFIEKYLFYFDPSEIEEKLERNLKDLIGSLFTVSFDIKYVQDAKINKAGRPYISEVMKVKFRGLKLLKSE